MTVTGGIITGVTQMSISKTSSTKTDLKHWFMNTITVTQLAILIIFANYLKFILILMATVNS